MVKNCLLKLSRKGQCAQKRVSFSKCDVSSRSSRGLYDPVIQGVAKPVWRELLIPLRWLRDVVVAQEAAWHRLRHVQKRLPLARGPQWMSAQMSVRARGTQVLVAGAAPG